MLKTINEISYSYNSDSRTPVFRHYDQQTSPQDAYLEINANTKTCYFTWNPEVGNGTSATHYYGQDVRISIPNNLSLKGVEALINDENFRKYVEALINSYAETMIDTNRIGTYGEDEYETLTQYVDMTIDEDYTINIAPADEYFHDVTKYYDDCGESVKPNKAVVCNVDDLQITAETSDGDLRTIKDELQSSVSEDYIVQDTLKFLKDIRQQLIDNQ